jgi:hypothetical protein
LFQIFNVQKKVFSRHGLLSLSSQSHDNTQLSLVYLYTTCQLWFSPCAWILQKYIVYWFWCAISCAKNKIQSYLLHFPFKYTNYLFIANKTEKGFSTRQHRRIQFCYSRLLSPHCCQQPYMLELLHTWTYIEKDFPNY